MRRIGALQAVLAGIGGGLEGRAAQRTREDELRRLDEERLYQRGRDAAASERQALLDSVALAEKGYVEQGERQETVKRASPALEAALRNAGGAMTGQAPTAAVDSAALRAAAGQFGDTPASRVTVGGKTLERMQTPNQERAMREVQTRQDETFAAQQEAERGRRVKQGDISEQAKRIKAALPSLSDEAALAIANGVPMDQFVMSPKDIAAERRANEQLALQREGLAIQREGMQSTVAARNAATQEKTAKAQASADALQSMLPTVVNAARDLSRWGDKEISKLTPGGVNAAMVAATSATSPTGMLASGALNKFMTNPLERQYAQYARAIGDAVARASEVGVLTNQDIARYQNQVAGVIGESPDDMRRKLSNLQIWANWLASNKGQLSGGSAASVSQKPGETPAEFAARTGRGPF